MNLKFVYTSAVAMFAAASVYGHGVQVQLTFNSTTGKIETRQIVGTTTTATAAEPIVPDFQLGTTIAPTARVFVMPLLQANIASGNGFYTRPTSVLRGDVPVPAYGTGPGLTYRYVYQNGAGSTGWDWGNASVPVTDPSLPNLAGSHFNYVLQDGLKQWNGTSWVSPDTEQLQLILNDGSGTSFGSLTTNGSPGGSIALSNVSTTTKPGVNSVPHSSVSFRLLGDGVNTTAPSDDGVYLLSLKVTSNATYGALNTPVGDSDPFYYVMYKNSSLDAAINLANNFAAANSIPQSQVQAVPEPMALSALALGGGMTLRRRRI